jgi:hypothetical protein
MKTMQNTAMRALSEKSGNVGTAELVPSLRSLVDQIVCIDGRYFFTTAPAPWLHPHFDDPLLTFFATSCISRLY